jgi:hypothetical protein
MSVVLTLGSSVEYAAGIVSQLFGLVALAAILAAVGALAYRATIDEVLPRWLAVLAGTSGVVVYLGTAPALETVVGTGVEPTQVEAAVFNVAAVLAAFGGSLLGRPVGDRYGTEVLRWAPTQETDDVSRLAQTVGQVTTVRLPNRIEDASGYDPIPDRTKESLEGKKLVFPRTVSVDELAERVRERLRSDYGIGTVDLEVDRDGDLSYLAVGTRAAGIGSTLPPATNAVALRADPGFSASTGDIVQVWEPERMERVLTGELRGVADDVVTVAVDAGDTPKVDPKRQYRLVTLPVEDRPDREFASLLRAAEETFSTATVEAGSPLHGLPVGALALTVIAIRPDDGEPVPFPDDRYRLAPGDLLFVIARPGGLRRLEAAAEPLDPAVAAGGASLPTDEAEPTEGIQTGGPGEPDPEESTGDDGPPADEEPIEGGGFQTDEEPADDGNRPAGEEPADDALDGKADAESFKQIKAQFEGADDSGEGEPATAPGGDETETAAETTAEPAEDEPGGKSFDELKAEFDSGDADWDEGAPPADSTPPASESEDDDGSGESAEPSDDTGAAFAEEDDDSDDELMSLEEADITFDDSGDDGGESEKAPPESGDDELVGLDEAEISFGDDAEDDAGDDPLGGPDIDDELQGDPGESLSDDIGDLEFEESEEDIDDLDLEADDGIFAEGDDSADEGEDEEDESDDGTEDDDSGGGGGGKSFAELKEEFDSGDADWEDDVSDSPGGDMRLDE